MLLSEFDITYVTQKSVKGRAISKQLAESPLDEPSPLFVDFPDESILATELVEEKWSMYFDGFII